MSNRFNFWKSRREGALYDENVMTRNAFFWSFSNLSSRVG